MNLLPMDVWEVIAVYAPLPTMLRINRRLHQRLLRHVLHLRDVDCGRSKYRFSDRCLREEQVWPRFEWRRDLWMITIDDWTDVCQECYWDLFDQVLALPFLEVFVLRPYQLRTDALPLDYVLWLVDEAHKAGRALRAVWVHVGEPLHQFRVARVQQAEARTGIKIRIEWDN